MTTQTLRMRPHRRRFDVGKNAFLVVVAVLTYLPFWLMVMISFKSLPQFYHSIWLPELPLQIENYGLAWTVVSRYLLNSVFVTCCTVFGVLAVSSLSAYGFARYAFPCKQLLFYLIIILLMVPAILTLVPTFVWVRNLGLLNTHWALILPSIAGQQVFAIFLLRSFMEGLPEDLFEAARMDGASMFQSYWHVALPLSRPALSVIAITSLLATWNDFIWPLVTISDDALRTIPIGLAFFQNQYQTEYGPQMAGFVIASVPLLVVFFIASREFVKGLTAGAVKF